MVLMRLLARARGPFADGGRIAVLVCATSPAQMISTPVRQLDFFYFDYVGTNLARYHGTRKSALVALLSQKFQRKEFVWAYMLYDDI
jgi:hypothetical protein